MRILHPDNSEDVCRFWCNSLFVLCPFASVAAEENMKDTSEPTGSPAPVIQHSSLAPSPSAGQNGLSSRAAAEAMAVLAGMGQQQRAESGPSHIIMAAQSQSAARWWAMPHSLESGVKKKKKKRTVDCPYNLSSVGTPMANLPRFPLAVLLCSRWDSGRAIALRPGAQQQPSGNGLRRLERASCSLCHRLQGLDSNLLSCFRSALPPSAVLTVRLAPPPDFGTALLRVRCLCELPCGLPSWIFDQLTKQRTGRYSVFSRE